MDEVLLAARIVLAAVFVVAALSKALDQSGTRRALEQFGLSHSAARVGRRLLPAIELAVGLGLLPAPTARWSALVALGLLVVFFAAVARVLGGGESPDCHCFGQVHAEPVGPRTLLRIVGFAIPAALVGFAGGGDQLALSGARAVPLVALTGAVVVLGALTMVLAQDNRRLRARAPISSRVGSLAPAVELRDLAGHVRSLHDEIDPELPSLVVFLSPGCSPCRTLARNLARWRVSVGDELRIVTLASGDPDRQPGEFRADELGLLLHSAGHVLDDFGVDSTPSAVLVGADRRISSRPAGGALAIEALVRTTLSARPTVARSRALA